jgi:hypothetical protein
LKKNLIEEIYDRFGFLEVNDDRMARRIGGR